MDDVLKCVEVRLVEKKDNVRIVFKAKEVRIPRYDGAKSDHDGGIAPEIVRADLIERAHTDLVVIHAAEIELQFIMEPAKLRGNSGAFPPDRNCLFIGVHRVRR